MNKPAAWPLTRKGSAAADASAWDSAFEQLFRQHYARIAGVLRKITGDAATAEELADEVFWKLYRQPPAEHDRLGGWLYRSAVRVGLDAIRARSRRQQYEAAAVREASLRAADPETELLRDEQLQRVQAVLADLKPAQAQLLLLRHAGHSYRELAALLGVQTSSIGTLLNRAEAAFERAYHHHSGKGERS